MFCILLIFLVVCEVAIVLDLVLSDMIGFGEWVMLIEVDWILVPGSEDFICVLYIIFYDVFICAFCVDVFEGIYYMVLMVTEFYGFDGVFLCDLGTFSDVMIFVLGFGIDDLVFFDGVAIRVLVGKQLLFNLYLVNFYFILLFGRLGIFV